MDQKYVWIMCKNSEVIIVPQTILTGISKLIDNLFNIQKNTNTTEDDNKIFIILLPSYNYRVMQKLILILKGFDMEDYSEDYHDEELLCLAEELEIVSLVYRLKMLEDVSESLSESTLELESKLSDHLSESDEENKSVTSTLSLAMGEFHFVNEPKILEKSSLTKNSKKFTANEVSAKNSSSQIAMNQRNRETQMLKSFNTKVPESWRGSRQELLMRAKDILCRINSSGKVLEEKNPVELLNCILKNPKYKIFESEIEAEEYIVKITLLGQNFSASGTTDKEAKLALAKIVLYDIFGIQYNFKSRFQQFQISFADAIQRLVLNKWIETVKEHPNSSRPPINLSAIIMLRNNDMSSAKVISIGTGICCKEFDNHDDYGGAIHDSHAEIIARRGLVRYLWDRIMNEDASAEEIFDRKSKVLKKGITFHLYVSHVPCGYISDKRIPRKLFQKQQNEKLQCSMSCVAKIFKWNILGIQGALLSRYIKPIYISSIIFGTEIDVIHFSKYINETIDEHIAIFPPGYRLNKISVCHVTEKTIKFHNDFTPYSLNWNFQMKDKELINGLTGKVIDGLCTPNKTVYSRLSKMANFMRYRYVAKGFGNFDLNLSYHQAKLLVVEYQLAKREFIRIIEYLEIGLWVKKPKNYEDFYARF